MSAFEGAVYPSLEFLRDPYPLYTWLRDEAPVYEVPGRGEFLVSRHADVLHVLSHPEIFSSAFPRQPEKEGRVPDVLESDPPRHAEEKRLVMTGIKPSRIQGHREAIAEVVDGLINEAIKSKEVAFVDQIAAKLPVYVFAAVFSLDPEELWEIHSSAVYIGPSRRYLPEDMREVDLGRAFKMLDYLGRKIDERHENPDDSLITEMIERQVARDGAYDLPLLQSEIDIMFTGGLTTTPHLLINALRLMLDNPEVLDRVRADYSLIPQMLDETLRLESPVQWQPRITLEDTEIKGVKIPKGARVLVVLGAANRDERVFSDPTRFDIDREEVKDHVALGHGVHFCVGAPLARLETTVALEAFFARVGPIQLSDRNDFEPSPGLSSRSLHELYLTI